jgi:hypothetical protein
MHVIAYPPRLTIKTSVEIMILFCTISEKILTQIRIKARRAVFTTSIIILWFVVIIPASAHVTTIKQFYNFVTSVVVSIQNTTQPFRITIPVVIHRQDRTILKLNTHARAGCHFKVWCLHY